MKITYPKQDSKEFVQTLKTRVKQYFEETQQSRKGNSRLIRKALIMLGILLLPYSLILTVDLPEWIMLILCVIMGMGLALVGINIMHDACHGVFSTKQWINTLAESTMYILGGDKRIWKTSHNILHHTFTNIHGHDIDLDAGNGILRFNEHTEWRPIHRYQHIYAFFLYSLLTLTWVFLTDFIKMKKFSKGKFNTQRQNNPLQNWGLLIFFKILAYTFWIIVPLMILKISIGAFLLGFIVMHLVAGVFLTLVFQLAHLTTVVEMPLPDESGNMQTAWAIHQLMTTANWATQSRLARWSMGGLNFQIEHHLFPGISHIHYPALAHIVKQTAQEFSIPYHEYQTLGQALSAHYRHLKNLGERPSVKLV